MLTVIVTVGATSQNLSAAGPCTQATQAQRIEGWAAPWAGVPCGAGRACHAGSGRHASQPGTWACRCRIPQFVELSRKVRRKREGVLRSVELGVSNARVEAVNNKIKVAIRQGYGFRNIDNLIALVMLRCSDLRPALPGRAAA